MKIDDCEPVYDEITGELQAVADKSKKMQYPLGNRKCSAVLAENEQLSSDDPRKFPMRIDPPEPDHEKDAGFFYARRDIRILARALHILQPLLTPERIKKAFMQAYKDEMSQ